MSVLTTRTANTVTTLSILKTNKSRPSSGHVHFQLPRDVRKIFLDLKNGVGSKEYETLVCTIRDSEISDRDLLKLLQDAKNCVSLLDYDLRLFVQALVILGWNYRSADVVHSYQDFMNNLLSAHPQHAKIVIDQLVKLFLNCNDEEWINGHPNEVDAKQFGNVHLILKSVVKIIPLTEDILISTLKTYYPYMRTPMKKQRAYMYNCLKVAEYLPNHRRKILLLLTEKLLILDVNCSREEIECPVTDIFPMDEVAPIVETLDCGMLMLFQYIESVCRPVGDEVLGIESKKMYSDLMQVLDRVLLSAHGNCHVQFLIFYFCSFKSLFTKEFLNELWKKASDPGLAPVVRRTAVAYLSSFLARADFITAGFLRKYLLEMSTWIHRYIVEHDGSSVKNNKMEAHLVFYSICQAVFYVIAFRHKDLVDSRKKLAFLQSLNLSKMINCSLNPLRACGAGVVENFAAVARDYQLAYCYTILEHNERSFLRAPTIDSFFPFDPYLLKSSSQYITHLYRHYKSPDDDDDDNVEEMEVEAEDKRQGEEDDDFIPEKQVSVPVKIPGAGYSSSPGFKMSI